MFLGDPYAQPEVVGSIDEALLDELSEQFPDRYLETTWYSSAAERFGSIVLPEAVVTLNSLILSREVQLGRREPYAIKYSVETGPISPGHSQRGQGWHVDGKGKNPGFVVADCLPTEFLVRKKESQFTIARFLPHSAQYIPLDLSDEEVEQKGLTVYRPEPYQLVAFSSNVHRSPVNQEETPVARTWIRAVIKHRRKDNLRP